MKGQYMSSGDVMVRELVGMTIPEEEVQSATHRDGSARPCGSGKVLLDKNTRYLLVFRDCGD